MVKLQLCYLFGEYGSALEVARTARIARQLTGTIWPVEFEFWNGLTLAANYTHATEEERTAYLQEMEEARRSLAILAENCPENFRCQSLLLSAEIERISGRPLAALELYEQAIEYAERHRHAPAPGLANELCARFWLERSQAKVAAVFLAAARQAYARWGATAKVSDLERRYGVSAMRVESDNLPAAGTAESTTLAEVSSIDLVTVMKAARVLAGEMELERLLEKLLAIAIENAGAERGGLVLEHDGAPRVHAQGSGDQITVQVHNAPTLTETDALPVVIVNYVRRTRESLVLADARSDDRYRHDPYVLGRQPRSVIATPLVNQGRLLGVVYLENNLATASSRPIGSRCSRSWPRTRRSPSRTHSSTRGSSERSPTESGWKRRFGPSARGRRRSPGSTSSGRSPVSRPRRSTPSTRWSRKCWVSTRSGWRRWPSGRETPSART